MERSLYNGYNGVRKKVQLHWIMLPCGSFKRTGATPKSYYLLALWLTVISGQ